MQSCVVVLNNIRSLYNVGSIFRTSDAAGVDKLYLCGITGTPEHPRLAKTALAALHAVPWVYRHSTLRTITYLKQQGYTIIALEQSPKSKPVTPLKDEKIALVLGHERAGVDAQVLERADHIMDLPMHGAGNSLNVAVAYGVAIYRLLKR